MIFEKRAKKDIFLIATRRGGSTIVAQVLASGDNIRYVDQPFDIFEPHSLQGAIKSKHLPNRFLSQFIVLNKVEEEQVKKYIHKLRKGKLRPLYQINPWNAKTSVLKIVNASALIDWFKENFDVHIIYLLRHPFAQALSIIKNNWGITVPAFLNNDRFSNKIITKDQYQLSLNLMDSGSNWEKAVLNWCYENIYPFKYSKCEKLIVTYEELILNPRKIIDHFSHKYRLPLKDKMLETLSKPSFSSNFSESTTLNAITTQNSPYLLSRWQTELTTEEKNQGQEILNLFGIDIYNSKSVLPHNRFLLFPNELQK
jgi:hypothetical protein